MLLDVVDAGVVVVVIFDIIGRQRTIVGGSVLGGGGRVGVGGVGGGVGGGGVGGGAVGGAGAGERRQGALSRQAPAAARQWGKIVRVRVSA